MIGCVERPQLARRSQPDQSTAARETCSEYLYVNAGDTEIIGVAP